MQLSGRSSKVLLSFCLLVLFATISAFAMEPSVKVFEDPGFPTADTAPIPSPQLHTLFPGATFLNLQQLGTALAEPTSLLVLPYGSAFPEAAWSSISAYLEKGGNLLVLGGQPFTRAAYQSDGEWKLRDYSVRFAHAILIDQYQETPGSSGLLFETNRDLVTQLTPFEWKRGFSPVIHLSTATISPRGGSAGKLDGRLDAMAWGSKNGIRLSAPVLQIDHLRSRFVGGRWIFLNADLPAGFAASDTARKLVTQLVTDASNGAEEFRALPQMPLYLPGESPALDVLWLSSRKNLTNLSVQLTVIPESEPAHQTRQSAPLTPAMVVSLPAVKTKGFHRIEATLMEGKRTISIYHSGFWVRDADYLRSGPKLSVNKHYFELDGKPIAVVGTTYMASDVQRLSFEAPNVFVWDRDLGQIQSAGLNMIRTGWWSGWDKVCDEEGRPSEHTLRTLEAYLMTARKYGLPVQFNVFAFLPDVLGGSNAYLDPVALHRQQTLVSTLAGTFHDVPFLAWDLINEPSIGQHVWESRPNGDAIELAAWNTWLNKKYSARPDLQHNWNLPSSGGTDVLPVPTAAEFIPRAMYDGANSLKLYDFSIFSQEVFANWVSQMQHAIRVAGSQQLVTVGQDEGGNTGRLSPAYFGEALDFTTNHSWWQDDSLLWDSLVAKQPGKAMLIQETGLQRGLNLDEIARRSQESEAALFERKVALSFVQGAGAIQWLWNTNVFMVEGNETSIGALRADGSEKPEAAVLRGFADFAKKAGRSLSNPQLPDVAIVASEASQFSVEWDLQMQAQRQAVRALCYVNRVPGYIIAESQIAKLGNPKLVILPSSQALSDAAWKALMEYIGRGGNLLVTGSVNRNEHWRTVDRLATSRFNGVVEPLTYHTASLQLGNETVPVSFDQMSQNWLEALRFADGANLNETSYGQGHIYWSALPVELAEGTGAAGKLYSYVLARAGITPAFTTEARLSHGVLIYPTVLENAVMYVMASDDAADSNVSIQDKLTGARFQLPLRSQHAAIVILSRKDGSVIAKYGVAP
jgi:hypothetical protein